jgi:uncharacterized protein with ParB-like and HNH nuclease domain
MTNAHMAHPQQELIPTISDEMRMLAELEIESKQKITDHDIREYPVEVIVNKYNQGREIDEGEIFVPDYQRELVWPDRKQARFIESILLNLPIPYLFVADNIEAGGRLEIVDGSQRIRTLVRYVENDLKLMDLELLPSLNGFYFSDLPPERQRRFLRKTLRMIELTRMMDEEARRQLFDRLNSGGVQLENMEQRFGSRSGPFLDFIKKQSSKDQFRRLCPVSKTRANRKEYEELALRFFAYANNYTNFEKSVDEFLNNYLDEQNKIAFNAKTLGDEFDQMLSFVENKFPFTFKKSHSNITVPRIRFEAISVGVVLSLRENPNLNPDPQSIKQWIDSPEFKVHTRSDASNSRPKVINRINFVRDKLLNKDPAYVAES